MYTKGVLTPANESYYSRYFYQYLRYQAKFSSSSLLVGKTLTGTYLKDWRTRIRNALPATTTMIAADVKFVERTPATAKWYNYSGECFWDNYSDVNVPFTDVAYSQTTADNAAYKNAHSRLASEAHAWTILGELRETVGLLRNPLHALRTLFNELAGVNRLNREKSRRFKEERKAWRWYRKAAADAWLEYSFGIAPIVADIMEVTDAIKRYVDSPKVERFSAVGRFEEGVPLAFRKNTVAGYINLDRYSGGYSKSKTRVFGAVRLTVETPVTGLLHQLGFRLENWLPSAWELLPWSFLIDYFTNAGDVLESWAIAHRGADFLYLGRTRKVERNYVYENRWKLPTNPALQTWTNGRGELMSKSVDRLALESIPIPSLQLRMNWTLNKALNIASLIAGRMADKRYVWSHKP